MSNFKYIIIICIYKYIYIYSQEEDSQTLSSKKITKLEAPLQCLQRISRLAPATHK